jgi:hypothetical protein
LSINSLTPRSAISMTRNITMESSHQRTMHCMHMAKTVRAITGSLPYKINIHLICSEYTTGRKEILAFAVVVMIMIPKNFPCSLCGTNSEMAVELASMHAQLS